MGTWVGEDMIDDTNLSGEAGGKLLLQDPADAGSPEGAVTTEADLVNAVRIALSKARPGDFVLMLVEHKEVYSYIQQYLDEYLNCK